MGARREEARPPGKGPVQTPGEELPAWYGRVSQADRAKQDRDQDARAEVSHVDLGGEADPLQEGGEAQVEDQVLQGNQPKNDRAAGHRSARDQGAGAGEDGLQGRALVHLDEKEHGRQEDETRAREDRAAKEHAPRESRGEPAVSPAPDQERTGEQAERKGFGP